MDYFNFGKESIDRPGLGQEDLLENPFLQFEKWFQEAVEADIVLPHAMSLATASSDASPSLRTVLLKTFDERGFVFFTNFESVKARQIAENPQVSLLFPWLKLERQVRIDGSAKKIPAAESLKYFLTRPLGSRLGAWASPQSSILSSRQFLEMKVEEMKRKFAAGKVPLPSFWGGYRVSPSVFEFWQGQKDRLHDRFQYSRASEGNWKIVRLAP